MSLAETLDLLSKSLSRPQANIQVFSSIYGHFLMQLIRYFCFMDRISREIDIGNNIRTIRELRGMKQSALAQSLGFTQQRLSLIEKKKAIDPGLLSRIADALAVPSSLIQQLNPDALLTFIQFMHSIYEIPAVNKTRSAFELLHKIDEMFRENKRLAQRLLEMEKQHTTLLQKLLWMLETSKENHPGFSNGEGSIGMQENIPYLLSQPA